jgi:hypothetical protein
MSLLTIDIKKSRRLSLKDIKLPTKEVKVEAPVSPPSELPPTEEELSYSRLVLINPLIERLVNSLGLVSSTTGDRIRKVELPAEDKPIRAPEVKSKEVDKPKLLALALRILKGERTYTKEDIIGRIIADMKVNQERAEKGFNLLLQVGAIQPVSKNRYYLTGSTPF